MESVASNNHTADASLPLNLDMLAYHSTAQIHSGRYDKFFCSNPLTTLADEVLK